MLDGILSTHLGLCVKWEHVYPFSHNLYLEPAHILFDDSKTMRKERIMLKRLVK